MVGRAGLDRRRRAHALLAACTLSLPLASAETVLAAELGPSFLDDQPAPLHREAPVFTYRQFTSLLPDLPSTSEETGRADVSESVSTAEPVLPGTTSPAARRQAGLMGRFGGTVDAVAARDGLSAPSLQEARPTGQDPTTTSAVAAQRPTHDPATATAEGRFVGSGRASWYQHPGRTASGETYNPNIMTAAHHSLPFGTRIKVVNRKNGRSVIVRITDRTNERTKAKRNYAIDLSRASARQIGIEGIGMVALYKVD